MLPSNSDLYSYLEKLQLQARRVNHRYLVVVSGEQGWCYQFLRGYLRQMIDQDQLLISSEELEDCTRVSYDRVDRYLGNEFAGIIYDAFSGFYPSAFALAEGTLRGGGLMLLLTPELEGWSTGKDSFCDKYAMYPYSAQQMSGYFVKRIVRIIKQDKRVSLISQHRTDRIYDGLSSTPGVQRICSKEYLTADQQLAVEKILHTARGHRNRPLVLLSNRGHGKSSALGIACAKLLLEQTRHITVSGPRKNATANVFRQAARLLGMADQQLSYRINYMQSRIEFIAPDALLGHPLETNLLLIDEAAALPLPLLESLLKQYRRVVFCSTVYGYEGNGRGFEIRFFRQLDKLANSWNLFRLDEPIRWDRGDPLEAFCFNAFLLDSELPGLAGDVEMDFDDLHFIRLDKEDLCVDDMLLQQLFGLLSSAHYKTTPNDLRMILDSPYVSVYVLKQHENICACALISSEGSLDQCMAQDILDGYRRTAGQMLPQTLINEHAISEAPGLRYARIMRIAVHPRLQGRGLGSRLLDHLYDTLRIEYDFLGASFGSDDRLFRFWVRAGYSPIKIGHKKNAYSGYHSLVVLKAISEEAIHAIQQVCRNYPQRLLYLLTDTLKYLDERLVYLLIVHFSGHIDIQLDNRDVEDLCSFAQAKRSFDVCAYSLYRLLLATLAQADMDLDETDLAILLHRLVQRHSESEVIASNRLDGKDELLDRLRHATARLLQIHGQACREQ